MKYCLVQVGFRRLAQNTAKLLGERLVFWVFNVFLAVYGFLIIPEWLILIPGHIAILFAWFLELPKNQLNMDPRTLYLSPKYFKKCKKLWERPWQNIVHICESEILKMLEGLWPNSLFCFCVFSFNILNFGFFRFWKNVILKFWRFESVKSWDFENVHRR